MTSSRSEEEQGEKGFTVSDKRLFTPEGQRRVSEAQTPPSRASAPPPPPRQETPPAPPRPEPTASEPSAAELPPADFATFVAMLANNVMMFLGQIPDPMSQQRRLDLQQARHTIDLLLMLRDKTRGNLTTEEAQLLEEILPQLQMAYVSVSRQAR